MTDLGITAEDEELMGTLDLNDFLPTNKEMNNEIDFERLGSQSVDIDAPKLSHDMMHKLEHYGHQEVDYHNPKSSRSLTGFPEDNDDVFDVDFDGEHGSPIRTKPNLAATAPVILQTPTVVSPQVQGKPAAAGQLSLTQHTPSTHHQHPTKKQIVVEEEEEEEELLVIPSSTHMKAAVQNAAAKPHNTESSAAASPTTHAAAPQPHSPLDTTPPGSIHKEKSREDTLPGKLQRKVSEARLQREATTTDDEHHHPHTDAEDHNDEEMMTDIEEMLLHRRQQKHEEAEEGEEEEEAEFALHKAPVDAQHEEEEVEEFEIRVDPVATKRYQQQQHDPSVEDHDREAEGDDEYAAGDEQEEDAFVPTKHRGAEPQQSKASAPDKQTRKSKLLVSQEAPADSNSNNKKEKKERPYQHPMNQGRLTIGNRTLTLAEAKLYGLIDAEGNPIAVSTAALTSTGAHEAPKVPLKRLSDMARPRSPTEVPTPEEEGFTFQPQRSASALKAMKNPKLGYDFVNRLDGSGGFLQRLDKDNHKKVAGVSLSKAEQAVMEEDYNAKLDKLTCPSCGKEQSFDEHLERSRHCRVCKVKYVKLKVSSGLGFLKQNAKREEERQRKMQKLEAEVYGDVGVCRIGTGKSSRPATGTLPTIPVRNTTAHQGNKRSSAVEASLLAKPPSPGDQGGAPVDADEEIERKTTKRSRPLSEKEKTSSTTMKPRPPSANKPPSSSSSSSAAAATSKTTSNHNNVVTAPMPANQNASEAVENMRKLHNKQAEELNKILKTLTSTVPNNDSHSQPISQPSGTTKASSRPRDTSVGRKMDRLMQID